MPGNGSDSADHAMRRGDDLLGIDDDRALEGGRKRMWYGLGVEPADGSVELVKRKLVDGLRELASYSAHRIGLVDDEQPVRFPDASYDGRDIERDDGSQVDHLALDLLGRESLSGLERTDEELPGGNDRQIAPLPGDAGDAEWHQVIAFGHFAFGREE